jgi:hypothetical protein
MATKHAINQQKMAAQAAMQQMAVGAAQSVTRPPGAEIWLKDPVLRWFLVFVNHINGGMTATAPPNIRAPYPFKVEVVYNYQSQGIQGYGNAVQAPYLSPNQLGGIYNPMQPGLYPAVQATPYPTYQIELGPVSMKKVANQLRTSPDKFMVVLEVFASMYRSQSGERNN